MTELLSTLPEALRHTLENCDMSEVREIYIRADAPVLLSFAGRNTFIGKNGKPCTKAYAVTVTKKELSDTVKRLCKGSVYSFEEYIKKGFIPFDNGIRIGVCGTLAGTGLVLSSINSVCIRIPHSVANISDGVMKLFANGKICGVLVFSAPSGGKTTLIRELCDRLSNGYLFSPKKVALMDERREFENSLPCCDVYSGYPKHLAIEYATRTMAPDVIVCDEIGSADECDAILSMQNTGVPLVATAHASSKDELYRRVHIKKLLDCGVFRYVYDLAERTAYTV